MALPACNKLFSGKRLYDLIGTDSLFLAAIRENVEFHRSHCPAYAALLNERGFQPERLRMESDLAELPPLPTAYLKSHPLFSVPENKLRFRAASSGTQGRVSEVGLDWDTARRALRMVVRTFSYYGLLSPLPTN